MLSRLQAAFLLKVAENRSPISYAEKYDLGIDWAVKKGFVVYEQVEGSPAVMAIKLTTQGRRKLEEYNDLTLGYGVSEGSGLCSHCGETLPLDDNGNVIEHSAVVEVRSSDTGLCSGSGGEPGWRKAL